MGERETVDAHLLACAACSDQLALLRTLVAGLRALPVPGPSADFTARVMKRWEAERDVPLAPEMLADAQAGEDAAPSQPVAAQPLAPVAAGSAPALVRGAPPLGMRAAPSERPRPTYSVKPFYGLVAAMFAVIFSVGLLTGKSYYSPSSVKTAGLVPNVRDMVDQVKLALDTNVVSDERSAPAAAMVNECAGRALEWHPTTVQGAVRHPIDSGEARQAELAIWVPRNVRVSFDSTEYSSGQLLLVPVKIGENGEFRTRLKWFAASPGRFDAWVETRWSGIYHHRPIVFRAVAP